MGSPPHTRPPQAPGTDEPENIPTAPTLEPRVAFETFARRGVQPAGQLYVTDDDYLLVKVHSSVAGLQVGVRVRLFQPDGQVIPNFYPLAPTNNRVLTQGAFQLSEGFLLGIAARLEVGVARRGQCFVEVDLVRGGVLATDPTEVLFADYVVTDEITGWPQGQVRQSVEGPGMARSITGGVPAAGAQISEVVPAGARWMLQSFRATLTTDAVVNNRRAHFIVDDGANILLDMAATDVQGATLVRNYNMDPAGVVRTAEDNEIYIPLAAGLVLFAGYRLRTTVTLMDVADQWTAPQYSVQEWLEP